MKWLVASCLVLLASCAVEPPPTAYVSVAENARSGGMRIARIDGEPVSDEAGLTLPIGPHDISVVCRLQNGIGATFDFPVDLKPNHSYCFFSRDQGKSCTIVYTQIEWKGGGAVSCR